MIASLLSGVRIRAVLLAAALLVGLSHQAQASPIACVDDTLTGYIALNGTGGCFIGSVVFGDFALLDLPFGSTPIPASDVHVAPSSGVSTATLDFSLSPTATADLLATLEILIGYNVSGGVSGATLMLAGASASEDASVTALENYCVGAPFSVACPGLVTAVFDPSLGIDTLSDASGPFGSTGLLGVVTDIAVGAGALGGASLSGPVTNQFDVAPTAAVPEPATLLLVAGGLAAARLRSKRSRPPYIGRRRPSRE